jgi:hypothetical protein
LIGVHPGIGFGFGPKLDASFSAGGDINRQGGWTFGGSCGVEAGPLGGSVDAGVNLHPNISAYGGGGYAIGAGGGCSADMVYNF